MIKSPLNNNVIAAIGVATLALPFGTFAWFSVPSLMSAVTFAGLGIVLLAASRITMNSWENAQPTENISHVLNRAEATTTDRR